MDASPEFQRLIEVRNPSDSDLPRSSSYFSAAPTPEPRPRAVDRSPQLRAQRDHLHALFRQMEPSDSTESEANTETLS